MSFTRTDRVACSVLVVEDDPLMLTAMGSILHTQGHRAILARNPALALQSVAAEQLDVIVLSIVELQSGCEFAQRLRLSEATRDVPIIFLVPELLSSWLPRLAALGGIFSLLKPIDPYALIDLVERALVMPHVARSRLGTPAAHLAQQADWIKLNH